MVELNRQAAGGQLPAAAVPGDWVAWRVRRDRPVYAARLWPNRSMGARGRRVAIGLAATGLAIPLLPALGTPVFWGLVPFLGAALWALWYALRRNLADGRLTEDVAIWRDEMRVERREPGGRARRWSADPFQVRIAIHDDAKIESYLTVRGGGREIELGAFLTPDERLALAGELEAALTRAIRA